VSPRIPTATAVKSAFVMFLSRLGSFNALEHVRRVFSWRKWIGGVPPSADSLGRICSGLDLAGIRAVNRGFYTTLRRKKGFHAPLHGQIALVLDGHESHTSERQRCDGCLSRRLKTKHGEKEVFYHRHVTALLVGRDFELLLDAEPQRPGDDEIAAALRLLDRVLDDYPRAFDVVLGDAIYTNARLYKLVLARGKHILTVLKENQPTLLEEARTLLSLQEPTATAYKSLRREVYSAEGFSLSGLDRPLRIVRSREVRRVRRQLTGQEEESASEWFWLTTLPERELSAPLATELGHSRWAIENQGFNECVNRWHADHVYKHDPGAMLALWLLCMTAFNLFQAFFSRNLQPAYRHKVTRQHVAELIRAELCRELLSAGRPP
jgi:hypothetical protein